MLLIIMSHKRDKFYIIKLYCARHEKCVRIKKKIKEVRIAERDIHGGEHEKI